MSHYRLGDLIERAFGDMVYKPEVTSWTVRGRWVDEDKFEIRPRPEYRETLITRKQEQIDSLIRQHESDEKYYKGRLQELKEEKEKLLRDRDNK